MVSIETSLNIVKYFNKAMDYLLLLRLSIVDLSLFPLTPLQENNSVYLFTPIDSLEGGWACVYRGLYNLCGAMTMY